MGHDELVTVDNVSRYELESTSSEKEENWSENLEQNSSDVNSTSSEVNSTLGVGKCSLALRKGFFYDSYPIR